MAQYGQPFGMMVPGCKDAVSKFVDVVSNQSALDMFKTAACVWTIVLGGRKHGRGICLYNKGGDISGRNEGVVK